MHRHRARSPLSSSPGLGHAVKAVLFLLLLAGCAAKPHPQLYHLGIPDPPLMQKKAGSPVLLLETSAIPRHLDRPQMVTRQGGFQLVVHEHHRWSAPLDRLMRESLALRMDARLPGFRVIPAELGPAYPPPALRLRLQIIDFSGDEKGEVRLSGMFSLEAPGKLPKEVPFDVRVFSTSIEPEALAASQSLALDGLAEQLMAEVRNLF
ncbi:PqiC family protein [Desulfobotulus sp.]|uniref:PqiC family protein n=1 Tax=Desulfobotulus sp. TaxID=1940337 RepID=UPI002A371C76|nr:PqiC family protein [Desulfobotulus sp.]MDY0162031.1 PqiC family protein [Desulfobotulus sp.]